TPAPPDSSTLSLHDALPIFWASLMDYDNGVMRDTFGLAKAYEMSPDGMTYTWHLRRGLCFSDGHPLTAEDVLFSFEVAYDEKLRSEEHTSELQSRSDLVCRL